MADKSIPEIELKPAEMFAYLASAADVAVRLFRGKDEQLVYTPSGFVLRQKNGGLYWIALSRICNRDGSFGWYRVHDVIGGRAARHINDETILVLQKTP